MKNRISRRMSERLIIELFMACENLGRRSKETYQVLYLCQPLSVIEVHENGNFIMGACDNKSLTDIINKVKEMER